MPLLSLGNVHVAVIDKTFDTSNRTQPICLIPLKTIKEDLTYLSGSVNSQMLLDNLSGESVCQLAVDHLVTVLGKLKSTPTVNLKVVFSNVKAVGNPPLLSDKNNSDSREILLDQSTDFAESPSDETTNQGQPSAFEIALRQVLDEEIQFLPTDTLMSLEKEECPEISNQTGACLDSLASSNCLQSHSPTCQLALATATLGETWTLENQEDTPHVKTHTSKIHPVYDDAGRTDTSGSRFTDPYHSETHTSDLLSVSKDSAETLGSRFADHNHSQSHPPYLQSMSGDVESHVRVLLPYQTAVALVKKCNQQTDLCPQGQISKKQMETDGMSIVSSHAERGVEEVSGKVSGEVSEKVQENIAKANKNTLSSKRRTPCETISNSDLLPPLVYTNQVLSTSKATEIPAINVFGDSEVHIDDHSFNGNQVYISPEIATEEEKCQEITHQTGACLDSLLDANCLQSQSTTLELGLVTSPKAKTGTCEDAGLNNSRHNSSISQPMSEDATVAETLKSHLRPMNDLLSHPSDPQDMTEGTTGSETLRSRFRGLNKSNIESSSPCTNPAGVVKNCHQETCLSLRGRISAPHMKNKVNSIVPGSDDVPGEGPVIANGQSDVLSRRVPYDTISNSGLLSLENSLGTGFGASKASHISTSEVSSGPGIQPKDHSRTENQKAFKTCHLGNSPKISVEKRSLTECYKTGKANKCWRLPLTSGFQLSNPSVDSTSKKLKMAIEHNDSGYSKGKAPNTRKEIRVGKNTVKSIKPGERCRCIKCGHYSICYANLIKHTVECHMKTVPCKCTDCGEEIRSAIDFQYHQLKHTEATQKDKDTLNRLAFTVRRDLKYTERKEIDTRKKETDTKKKLICKICGQSCTNKFSLRIHLRKHSGEKPFHCVICDWKFASKGSLTSHMNTHSRDKRFNCTLCHKTFGRNNTLKQHMLSHTAEKVHRCLFCAMIFPTEDLLRQHMSHHESRGKSLPACEICDKSFITRPQLKRHMRTHNEDRPYKCDMCERSFAKSLHLSDHRRMHAKEKERVCYKCGEQFTCSSLRQVYLCNACQASGDNSLFTCYVCKKKFKKLDNLKQHLKCHSSERRCCSICGKIIKQSYMYVHVLRKHHSHPSAKFVACCAFCGKAFKSNAGLKSHERIVHSAENKDAQEIGQCFE